MCGARLRLPAGSPTIRPARYRSGCTVLGVAALNRSSPRTIDLYFEETGFGVLDVAARSGLSVDRVEAIALGRWTPSPAERAKIAAVFGVEVGMISWGHTMDPRNVRYRRFGLKEDF